MKTGFYAKLALVGIRKNRQLYDPYLLTCVGMVFIYFIIASLADSSVVAAINGARTTQILLGLGKYIIAIFAVIFLFYTNSFLTRRRQKEFGLYNVLGMSKRNIARILLWETILTAVIALGGGTLLGILLYKLSELVLVRVMRADAVYEINIVWSVIPQTILIFGAIFLLLFLVTLLRIRLSNPIALLRSENAGEKPPKANGLLGLAGLVILGSGYYIAVTTDNILQVFSAFLIAVVLVIIGTYLIFISGSVVLCRLLQKNKAYYYKPNHFVSVASMTYRMKRNGAGLASICILATSVLIIMSVGVSLIFGMEDVLRTNYPAHYVFFYGVSASDSLEDEQKEELREFLMDELTIESEALFDYIYAYGDFENETLTLHAFYLYQSDNTIDNTIVYIVDQDTWNRISGDTVALLDGEILLGATDKAVEDHYSNSETQLELENVGTFQVKGTVEYPSCFQSDRSILYGAVILVTADLEILNSLFATESYNDESMIPAYRMWEYRFNVGESSADQVTVYGNIAEQLNTEVRRIVGNHEGNETWGYSSLAYERSSYYTTFGGIFFLGVLLSGVFLCATVLIIYYKQISEGYEDARRFEIMQKVGMTKKDIRKSVNSQMLTVFALPIGLAGVHVVFAFPIVKKVLLAASLDNTRLFILATCGSFAVFVCVYAAVYRLTSNTYYKLVSGQEKSKK